MPSYVEYVEGDNELRTNLQPWILVEFIHWIKDVRSELREESSRPQVEKKPIAHFPQKVDEELFTFCMLINYDDLKLTCVS